jgi:hypothetical protein
LAATEGSVAEAATSFRDHTIFLRIPSGTTDK